jgi:hypothetical protein
MVALVNLGDTEVLTVARAVLLALLPDGVEVIRAYANRVPEPIGPDFVVLSPLRRERLSTNRDIDLDLKVIGSIAGETMTVPTGPALAPGYGLYGPGVVRGSVITAAGPDAHTYTVAPPQTAPAGSTLYVGRHLMSQPIDYVFQADVFGPASSRNVEAIATIWRDDAGCQAVQVAAAAFGEMQPLFADDPHMAAFQSAESAWEDRWIVDLHLQINTVVTVGQQFADTLAITMLPVDLFLIPAPAPHA